MAKLHRTEFKKFDEIMTRMKILVDSPEFNSVEQYNKDFFWNYRTNTFYLYIAMSDISGSQKLRFLFRQLCHSYKYFLGKKKSPLTNLAAIMIVRNQPDVEGMFCFLDNEWQYDAKLEEDLSLLEIEKQFQDVEIKTYYS